MKPVDVKSSSYIDSSKGINDKDSKFKISDIVRISKYKNSSAKGYTPNWPVKFLWLKKLKILWRGHIPANIRLDEDILKTSLRRLSSLFSEDIFKKSSRRLDQDKYIYLTHTSSEDAFKTSSRRLDQDQYIRLGHTFLIRLQDVFNTSSRHLQDVLPGRLQDIFKTSCKDVFKDVFKTYHQVKLCQGFASVPVLRNLWSV